jgi:membrane associated rhomboid family serine protease
VYAGLIESAIFENQITKILPFMMEIGLAGIVLILINIGFSYKGFTDPVFFSRFRFGIQQVLYYRQYYRLVTSGFLHVSWPHLIFNMLSLYAFSDPIEIGLGVPQFLCIYFAGLVGGNLFSLYIHRHHHNYSAAGASGAVCAIIFACIAIFPDMGIGLFGLPLSIPGWVYGVLYVLFSIYGVKSVKNNIGHDAHLGGALVGMLAGVAFYPNALRYNYLVILAIALPVMVFIYLIITRPHILLIDNYYFKQKRPYYNIDQAYNAEKLATQDEIDSILDKISRNGMGSLTPAEREKLKTFSGEG